MIRSVYKQLEKRLPASFKNIIPEKWRIWLGYQIKVAWNPNMRPIITSNPVSIPEGFTEQSLSQKLASYYIKGEGQSQERFFYLQEAYKRFLYTLELVPNQSGSLLEIGSNPYFMTLLLQWFRDYDLTLVNYFGTEFEKHDVQIVINSNGAEIPYEFDNINIEEEVLPYAENSFDVVLLCEVLEHFTADPLNALLGIKRVLKDDGVLILTTPNVARLENISRLLAGENLYDPYSGYGPHGRHNREYTTAELQKLLEHAGFEIERQFSSDVHRNLAEHYFPPHHFRDLIESREKELGHYLFVKAINKSPANELKPKWLYRSYAEELLD